MAAFISKIFGGGAKKAAPAKAPSITPKQDAPTTIGGGEGEALGKKKRGVGRAGKTQTTYTSPLGISAAQKSDTNLKTLLGA